MVFPLNQILNVSPNLQLAVYPKDYFSLPYFFFHDVEEHQFPSYCTMAYLSLGGKISLQSVSWILAEFYFNRGLQRLYTGTCIILQKTINGFLCLIIVFLKSKTYQLILKDVIKLNRNLR